MNERKDGVRMALYQLAGIYLFILAYQLYGRFNEVEGNEKILILTFTIIFSISALLITLMTVRYVLKESKNKSKLQKNENIVGENEIAEGSATMNAMNENRTVENKADKADSINDNELE